MEFRKMAEEETAQQEWLDEKMDHMPSDCFGLSWSGPTVDKACVVSWKLNALDIVLEVFRIEDGKERWELHGQGKVHKFEEEAHAMVVAGYMTKAACDVVAHGSDVVVRKLREKATPAPSKELAEAERVSKNEAELQADALEALSDWTATEAARLRKNPDASISTGALSSDMHNIVFREGVRQAAWRMRKRAAR